jgi:UDP-GlcNAc:undecaprenyl-phosphate/decaprenyl-phosphate GlcNAc-1-phosphate transferase
MLLILVLGIVSWLLSSCLTPLVLAFARRFGIVDRPDDARKFHKGLIPRLGGIAVTAAYLISVQFLRFPFSTSEAGAWNAITLLKQLYPGLLLIFFVGLYDDLYGLKPIYKLLVQVIAALTVYSLGVRVMVVDNQVTGPWWSLIITLLWLVVCTNAINLIDGLDGLATGVGICASAVTMIAALRHGNTSLALVTVPLVGGLVGFLRYNFSPAKIFLGDCGSLTIGFLLGCYGIEWGQKSATLVGMVAPVLALSVPLLDTCVSILRRFLGGRPVFSGDRGHIHHRLLDRGLTPARVALFLYVACTGCAIAAACMEVSAFRLVTLLVFGTFTVLGIRYLDYAEFSAATRVLRRGAVLRLVQTEMLLEGFERAFEAARSPEECWLVLKRFYVKFGFCSINCSIAGTSHSDSVETNKSILSLRIQLSDNDYVEFQRPALSSKEQYSVEALLHSLQSTISRKMVWSSWAELETDLLNQTRRSKSRFEQTTADQGVGI